MLTRNGRNKGEVEVVRLGSREYDEFVEDIFREESKIALEYRRLSLENELKLVNRKLEEFV